MLYRGRRVVRAATCLLPCRSRSCRCSGLAAVAYAGSLHACMAQSNILSSSAVLLVCLGLLGSWKHNGQICLPLYAGSYSCKHTPCMVISEYRQDLTGNQNFQIPMGHSLIIITAPYLLPGFESHAPPAKLLFPCRMHETHAEMNFRRPMS